MFGACHQLGQFLVGELGSVLPGRGFPARDGHPQRFCNFVVARFGLIRSRLSPGIRDLASLIHSFTHDNSALRNTNKQSSGTRDMAFRRTVRRKPGHGIQANREEEGWGKRW